MELELELETRMELELGLRTWLPASEELLAPDMAKAFACLALESSHHLRIAKQLHYSAEHNHSSMDRFDNTLVCPINTQYIQQRPKNYVWCVVFLFCFEQPPHR